MGMKATTRQASLVVLGWSALTSPVAGQRLMDDWLIRTGAAPGALQAGASAAFWNPAGADVLRSRGALMVLELLAPEATGVDVLAFSGGWRLDERTTLVAGDQHLGVEGMEFTGTTPEGGIPVDISQDLFAVAASRRLTARLAVGAGAQYLRSSEALKEDDQLAIGAGARLLAPLPIPVTVGGYGYSLQDRLVWGIGVEVAPRLPVSAWRGAVNAGVGGGHAVRGTSYRAGVSLSWREMVELGGSMVGEPDGAERQWEPVLSGSVRLSRYELGVVREWLPNSFGTVHTFRFGIAF
jgi:hypothetical protein